MTRTRRRWQPRSLRTRLVLGVSGIVSIALIAIGAVAEMSLRDEVASLGDSQVAHSLAAFNHSYGKGAPDLPGIESASGQAPGTVIALLRDGQAVFSSVITDGEPATAPTDAIRELEAAGRSGGGAPSWEAPKGGDLDDEIPF